MSNSTEAKTVEIESGQELKQTEPAEPSKTQSPSAATTLGDSVTDTAVLPIEQHHESHVFTTISKPAVTSAESHTAAADTHKSTRVREKDLIRATSLIGLAALIRREVDLEELKAENS